MKIEPVAHPDQIINYWKKEKAIAILILLFGLAFNVSMVLGPIWQGKLIDAIATGRPFASLLKIACTFVALILAIQVLRYYKRYYIRRFANTTSASMRLMIYGNIMHKNLPAIDREDTGNLMTRAISDVDLCVEGMRKFTTELFDTCVLMVTYIVSLLMYDVKITLLSLMFIPVAMFLAEKLKETIHQYTVAWRKKNSEIADLTYESIENAMLYRVKGLEKENQARYFRELDDLQKKSVRANLLENSMQPIYNIIAMTGIIFVIWLGGNKVIAGDWTIGNFSAYLAIFVAMAFKASKASKLFNSVQKSQISWKRIKPYLAECNGTITDEEKKATAGTDYAPDAAGVSDLLSVENLSLRFEGNKSNTIEDISVSGNEGEIIGVTGPVACGKSTLALALLGLYPHGGHIKVNGIDIWKCTDEERSNLVSYMGHRAELLSDSIYNNITLGIDADISEVLKDVCFDDDLANMPDGQETLVGNSGIRLSGGQQARIALARALLGKKKIIVLDDPFSAVDVKTEKRIIKNLRNNYRHSLIILISHRLTIFPETDRIILMHGDKTVEYGTHAELMQKSDLYAEIFRLQCIECGTPS